MSLVIYDFAVNGVTPGTVDPQDVSTAQDSYSLVTGVQNKAKSVQLDFEGLKKVSLHIDWDQAVAAGTFRVQLGMEGSTAFFTVLEFNAATDFTNSVDKAMGLTFNSGVFELIRFDGSSVTGGSPVVRIG